MRDLDENVVFYPGDSDSRAGAVVTNIAHSLRSSSGRARDAVLV